MAREDPQLKLRVTDEMRARLIYAARASKRSVNAEIVQRLEESFARERWLNDLATDGQDEEAAAVRRRYDISPNPSGQFVAPEGVSEEQLSRFIADELKKANLVAIERIAAGLRKVGGNYIPFDPEGDDTTKE